MKSSLLWSKDALEDLEQLPNPLGVRITKKVIWFSQQQNPLTHAEPLTGPYQGIYRFRVGDYRVLFQKDAQGQVSILKILRIKHRREVYR